MGYECKDFKSGQYVTCVCDHCGKLIPMVMGLPTPGVIRHGKTYHAKCWREIKESGEGEDTMS